MLKVADKPSQDPVQQKLRLMKKEVNKETSAFIDNLIHFKKLMNGQPNKFFKEKSTIKDPIPGDPTTILGSLAGDFQDLARRNNSIIAAQIEYSKTRRKSQPKKINTPGTPGTPAPANILQQLGYLETKYELIAEASSPISRFFTRLLTPTFGFGEAARIRKYRMSLLKSCAEMYKDLGKFQVEVVKSSKDSINKSQEILHEKIWRKWDLINKGIKIYQSNMPMSIVDSGGPIDPIDNKEKSVKDSPEAVVESPILTKDTTKPVSDNSDLTKKVKSIRDEYIGSYTSLDAEILRAGAAAVNLEKSIEDFLKSPDKSVALSKVISDYQVFVSHLNSQFKTNGSTITEVIEQKSATDQLEKNAQDFLKKWIGKKQHQLSVFDQTSGYRLDLYKMADEIRELIDEIMNSLEKEMNIETISDISNQVNAKLASTRGLMRSLYLLNPKNKSDGFFG